MEKEMLKHNHNHHHHHQQQQQQQHNSQNITSRERQIIGEGLIPPPQSADFVLRWGNRKRLRCMKIQVKDATATANATATHRTATVRRVIRSETASDNNNGAHFNLRQRPASPARPPLRTLRNNNSTTESGSAMKGMQQSNGVRGMVVSPERGGGGAHENGVKTTSSDKGGSSSGGSEVMVWPPKFMIALTNKEKEEDFMAIKGSKLPQRPKKRAKFVQRTLNLVSPGGWLCDLTLERYEVREKKTSKKRPRGLKAMGNCMDSDSE